MSINLVLAAPFKYQKTGSLKRSAVIYYLVLEKKWMNKKQAEKLLEFAVKNGLAGIEGEEISLLFDYENIDIPLGFKPGPEIFNNSDDPLSQLAERIAEGTGMEYASVMEEIERIASEEFDGNLFREAAAVVLARRHNIGTGDLTDPLYQQAFGKTK